MLQLKIPKDLSHPQPLPIHTHIYTHTRVHTHRVHLGSAPTCRSDSPRDMQAPLQNENVGTLAQKYYRFSAATAEQ